LLHSAGQKTKIGFKNAFTDNCRKYQHKTTTLSACVRPGQKLTCARHSPKKVKIYHFITLKAKLFKRISFLQLDYYFDGWFDPTLLFTATLWLKLHRLGNACGLYFTL